MDKECTDIEQLKKEFKFQQLKPGMRFLVSSGWDDFEHEIVSVDYDNLTFQFRDHSMINSPIEYKKLHTGKNIPYDLYENYDAMRKREKFKFSKLPYERDKKIEKLLNI